MQCVESITDAFIGDISLISDAMPVSYFEYKQSYSLSMQESRRSLI
jgi:hypothetical protein